MMRKKSHNRSNYAGFGLVELMISITLGLVLSTAVIQVFVASNSSSLVQESLGQIQENARFAMRTISQEVRMSGYMGCTSIGVVTANNVALPASAVNFTTATAFVGQDNLVKGNALGAVIGTDSMQIKRASDEFIRMDSTNVASASGITINDNTLGLAQSDYVMVSDCLNADIFRVTNTPLASGKGATALNHASGSKNSSSTLGNVYGPDAEIFAFETINYFVRDTGRDNEAGDPINALYVQQIAAGSGGAMSAATELVEGVEDLQLTYGVDTNNDRAVDEYRTAAAVADWSRVLSVKIVLQMVGSENNVVGRSGSDNAQSLVDVNGNLIANNDGRLRQIFTSVFAIRNKVP
jgi:type IV pilus assembly protein PilW